MRQLLKYWDLITLFFFIIIYSLTFSWLAILRHEAFASSYDLANMGQTVWNTLYGHFFSFTGTQGTVSRLSVHADFLLILFAPLYLIWNNIRVLLIAQSVGLALGALPTYFLAKSILGSSQVLGKNTIKIVSLIIAAVYLLNPNMEWTNSYDFHAVAFAIPLFLAAFYFAHTKKWWLFALFALLTLLTKEELGLDLAMLGLYIAVIVRQKRIGMVTFLIGMIWTFAMIFVVIPGAAKTGTHWAFAWYSLDDTTPVALNLPEKINDYVIKTISTGTLGYFNQLIHPFAYLPLLGLPFLFLSLPEILINILSDHGQMQSTMFHYDSAITPAIIIATIYAYFVILFLLKHFKITIKIRQFIILGVAVCSFIYVLRVNYHQSPLPITPSCWCLVYQVSADDVAFNKLLQQLPKNATITSSPEVRAHVTRREYSYTLPSAIDTADYVALIDQNRIVGDYSPKTFENELIPRLQTDSHHILVSHLGHFWLFKKI